MSLESLKNTIKEKKLSKEKMISFNGGYTRTGCQRVFVTPFEEYSCSDTDADGLPPIVGAG